MVKMLEEGGVSDMEELYTVDEVADKLKVSKVTLYSYMKDGIVPFVKLGGQRRFIGSQVMSAIKKIQTVQSVQSLRPIKEA
jgi:excisionase family DNA binding protein